MADELPIIIKQRFAAGAQPASEQEAQELAEFYFHLGSLKRSQAQVTLREIITIFTRARLFQCSIMHAAQSLLGPRVQHEQPELATAILAAMRQVHGWEQAVWPNPDAACIEQVPRGVRVSNSQVEYVLQGAQLDNSPLWRSKADAAQPLLPTLRSTLVSLALASAAGEPALLVGPSSCKNLATRVWSDVTGGLFKLAH